MTDSGWPDGAREAVRDWHSENITLRRGLPGAKPAGFAQWILRLLNVRSAMGDTIDDLFPGTGGVADAWAQMEVFAQPVRLPGDQWGCP